MFKFKINLLQKAPFTLKFVESAYKRIKDIQVPCGTARLVTFNASKALAFVGRFSLVFV